MSYTLPLDLSQLGQPVAKIPQYKMGNFKNMHTNRGKLSSGKFERLHEVSPHLQVRPILGWEVSPNIL